MAALITTEALVLRKIDYAESSVIIAVLTRDAGQQQFLVRGARRQQKKRFPQIDLFRRLSVLYKPSAKSDLHAVHDVECMAFYDSIASSTSNFSTAKWLCEFTLRNSQINVPATEMFDALDIAFSRLASHADVPGLPITVGVCFATLMEYGVLPDYSAYKGCQTEIERVREFALNQEYPAPDYSAKTWENLRDWTSSFMIEHAEFQVPKGWNLISKQPRNKRTLYE